MKTHLVLSLLTLLIFCGASTAQTRATINFDLRPDSDDTSSFAGTTRPRTVKNTNGPASSAAADIEQQVFTLINAERAKNGLSQLEWSESIAAVARLPSQDMANVKFFSHRGSDGSMVDERADRLGLGTWRLIGENIAYM